MLMAEWQGSAATQVVASQEERTGMREIRDIVRDFLVRHDLSGDFDRRQDRPATQSAVIVARLTSSLVSCGIEPQCV